MMGISRLMKRFHPTIRLYSRNTNIVTVPSWRKSDVGTEPASKLNMAHEEPFIESEEDPSQFFVPTPLNEQELLSSFEDLFMEPDYTNPDEIYEETLDEIMSALPNMEVDSQHQKDSFLDDIESIMDFVDVAEDEFLTEAIDKLENSQKFNELYAKQKETERKSLDEAIARYREAVEGATKRGQGISLPPAKKVLISWFEPLVEKIKQVQKDCHNKNPPAELKDLSGLLTMLHAEQMAVLTLHELLGSTLEKDHFLKSCANAVGASVFAEFNYKRLSQIPFGTSNLHMDTRLVSNINSKARWHFKEDSITSLRQHIMLGAYLIKLAIDTSKIEDEPAFTHVLVVQKENQKIGMITLNEKVRSMVTEEHQLRELHMYPRYVPMLVPPRPWKSFKDGGYLEKNHVVMRVRGSKSQSMILRDAQMQDLLEGLNVLNDTAWRVNQVVFKVFMQIWQEGGGLGEQPPKKNVPLPQKPETEDTYEIYKWRKATDKAKVENRNRHSRRCDTLYKIQVAQDFIDEKFYFPHNIDFRGRSYPIPPHLNHLGADMNRGLLMFDEGKRIGKRGIFWLKVHLANLIGQDKLTLNGRIKFVDKIYEKIYESATNPLNGSRWWLLSENPWQTLAACIELVNCNENEDYISRLPIQIDGSCNGLQHYAALGRDHLGALHVNLLPSEKPMDVYSGVLQVVNRMLEKDYKSENPLAKLLYGKVVRSTIKQTVMTSVYGVTFIGARKQIFKRLKERGDVPDGQLGQASIYLTKLTFDSMGEVFAGAYAIMDWLNECAHLISSSGYPVIWVTPLGLPVLQPYRAPSSKRVKTILQTVLLTEDNEDLPISRDRQKSAFPPNYVHSLDASHMFMSAKACKEHGLSFASVHDSFWTHASDTELMNKLLREEFIKLHTQPLLETLLQSFRDSFPDIKFPDVPPKGALDITRVRASKYFFD